MICKKVFCVLSSLVRGLKKLIVKSRRPFHMKNKQPHDPNPSGVVFLQKVNNYKLSQARALRKNMTPEERMFWERVRANRFMGLQFRRQQIVEGFIVDFYCNKARCVVEIDGGIHNNPKQKAIDQHRKAVFKSRGLTEIRFTNKQIQENISGVFEQLRKMIEPVVAANRLKVTEGIWDARSRMDSLLRPLPGAAR
jgi:very-short-patch-repair endonuclease